MEFHNAVLLITAWIGFLNLSKFILKIIKSTWIFFFRPAKNLNEYGSWALITGSTDGIGKALACEMAANGLNLVLVGRNPSKLRSTSEEIRQKHSARPVSVKTVVIDFISCGGDDIARIIEEETRGLDVGIVVNNVGLAYPYARFFHEVDLGLMESVVRVNVEATTRVTAAVIGRMLEKKKGAIVNVGSGSSHCVSSYPLYSVYAATKAYVEMLSKSMTLEYKQHGIDVQCQVPLFVATKMTSIKKSSFFIPSPQKYSKASIKFIGHNDQICMPYWPHALQAFMVSLIPDSLLDWCIFKYFHGMRARGLRKDARKLNEKKLVQDRFDKKIIR